MKAEIIKALEPFALIGSEVNDDTTFSIRLKGPDGIQIGYVDQEDFKRAFSVYAEVSGQDLNIEAAKKQGSSSASGASIWLVVAVISFINMLIALATAISD